MSFFGKQLTAFSRKYYFLDLWLGAECVSENVSFWIHAECGEIQNTKAPYCQFFCSLFSRIWTIEDDLHGYLEVKSSFKLYSRLIKCTRKQICEMFRENWSMNLLWLSNISQTRHFPKYLNYVCNATKSLKSKISVAVFTSFRSQRQV